MQCIYNSTRKSNKTNLLLLILGKGSCDFETDWCGWRDDSGSGDSYWLRTTDKETEEPLNLPQFGKCFKLHHYLGPVYTNIKILYCSIYFVTGYA